MGRFSNKNKMLLRSLERRLMFDAAAVNAIAAPVFQFDAQDIDADGDTADQPADGVNIGSWNDSKGNDDAGSATGGNQPTYDDDAFGPGRGGLVFDGDDEFGMSTTTELNNQTFYEKSFAVVFKTGSDVSGHQVIYEQGGGTKGYQISIADGRLYAFVWNKTNWSGTDRFRSIDLGAVQTNEAYRVVAIHDANTTNTWSANVNGGTFQALNGVGFQGGHSGQPAIGGVVNASLHPVTFGNAGAANFQGAIGELWSWNHALTSGEAADVESYLSLKWFNSAPVLDTNTGLSIVEGGALVIGSDKLASSDLEQTAADIAYEITSLASDGDLRLNGVSLSLSDVFTQQDVDEGRLSYIHDGSSNPADSFSFTISDGIEISAVETFNVTINPPPASDPVISVLAPLNAVESDEIAITTSEVTVIDLDTPPANVIYEITALATHGDILNNGTALGLGDTFTQQDLINGVVTYRNNGAGEFTSDSFGFTVTDGSFTTSAETMPILITLADDEAPVVTANNALSISNGASGNIVTGLLQSSDLDSADAGLIYEITQDAVHGSLQRSGVDIGVGDSFTQNDVDSGLVTYNHSGNAAIGDNFSFTVSDGLNVSAEDIFSINIGGAGGGDLSGDTPYPNIVFHYDAQDIDDNPATSNPADGTDIDSWQDTSSNNYDATSAGSNRPVYDVDAFNGRGGIRFDGVNHTLDIADSALLNTGSYAEKSFAMIFETGADVSGVQIIYEQGGGGNGYNIAIVDGNLYAYVWGESHFPGGDQLKSINLGAIQENTIYDITVIHDATGATLDDRTFSASLNGGAFQVLTRVDVQGSHGGDTAIGGVVNNSQNPVTNSDINGNDISLFQGAVGELISWNYALTAQDAADVHAYIENKWLNAAPDLSTNTGLTIFEGVETLIGSDVLEATDSDQSAAEIVYTIVADASNGELKLSGVDLNLGDSFTQQDINDGLISFAHDGISSGNDNLRFTLSDGLIVTAAQNFEVTVNAFPSNDPVITTLLALPATEASDTVLTTAILDTTDLDTADSNLVYEITTSSVHGDVLRNGVVLSDGDSFTQSDIANGVLVYRNNGVGEFTSDSFSFTVTDGAVTTAIQTLPITISLVNDEVPLVVTNSDLTITTAATATLSSANLTATDLDTDDTTLIYEITSNAARGSVLLSGVALNLGDTFTQDDIDQGRLGYTHDGSTALTDSFSFTVTDGLTITAIETFDIVINPIDFEGDTSLPDVVFHFDAQDIDNNSGTSNPADETVLTGWSDTSANGYDGTSIAGFEPLYDADAFGGLGGVRFDGGGELFTLPVNNDINALTYDQKSIAMVFETGADVSGAQVIYEQGGGSNGYNIAIVDGRLYAYAWAETYWAGGDQIKSIDLGAVEANRGYHVTLVHDATASNLSDRTFSAAVNGGALQTLSNVDVMGAHVGTAAIGGVYGDSQNPFNDSDIGGDNIQGFNGSVGEVLSWNYALSETEIAGLDNYIARKWLAPQITINTAMTLNEGASAAILTSDLNAFDLDQDNTGLVFTLEADTANGSLSNTGFDLSVGDTFTLQDIVDGNLSYAHDGSETVADGFSFSLSDGRTILSGNSFVINVNAVNDAPTDITLSSNSIAENSLIGDIVGQISTTDVDGGVPTYSIVGSPEIFSVSGNDLVLTAVPDYETAPNYTLTLRADDGAGGTFDRLFTINIGDINENPPGDNIVNIDTNDGFVNLNRDDDSFIPASFDNDFEISELLRATLQDLNFDFGGLFSDGQLVKKAIMETLGAQGLSFYASGDLEEILRNGGTVEAFNAIDALSRILAGEDGDGSEYRDLIYDYLAQMYGDQSLQGLSVEYQKFLNVLAEIDKTLGDTPQADLSQELLNLQSRFDNKVESFLEQL